VEPSIERVIEDTRAIALIPAPTHAEGERIAWVEERLRLAPGRRARDEVGNLIWTWADGRPRLMLTAHVDTVFPAEVPHTVRRTDGKFVGPGVGDNAVAVASLIYVVEKLLESRPLSPGAVAFTVGEEGLGNLVGATAACQEVNPEAVIAVEGHGLDRVFVDALGSCRAKVAIHGPGGHSWTDRGRPSAVHEIIELASRVLGIASPDCALNIGLVSGGIAVNSIAEDAQLVLEMRSLDQSSLEEFERVLAKLDVAEPLALSVEIVGRRPGGRLHRGSDLLQVVQRVRQDLGLPYTEDAASTDANAALAQGIPALGMGIALGGAAHSVNEYIDIESINQGNRLLEGVISSLL
jgi:tripeptide aminopeptidase